jgi:hypothetical protein
MIGDGNEPGQDRVGINLEDAGHSTDAQALRQGAHRPHQFFAHSTELRGEVCHRSAKASGGEDLQVEKPVSCWDCASFHFHATVAGMLGPTLIRDEVV